MFQVLKRVIWLLAGRKLMVFLLSFSNLIFALLVLVEPIFFREVIDILINGAENSDLLIVKLVFTLAVWVCVWIFTISIRLFVSVFSDRLAHEELDKNIFSFYKHVQKLSMRFHLDSDSGQLVKKITKGTDGIFEMHLNIFRRAMPSIFIVICLIPVVLFLNLKLGLFLVVTGIISACISLFLASKTFTKQAAIEDIYSWMSSHYGDTFSNMQIVKSFNLWTFKNTQLRQKTDQRLAKQYPILIWWGLIVSFFQILKIIISIWIISFWSYLYVLWEISIWEIVMFLSFSFIFLSSIEDITRTLEWMFWRMAGVKDYFEILDTKMEVQDRPGAKTLKKVKWEVDFRGVAFSYDGKRQILEGINMSVAVWEKIAFVGHTGSGKTTMTNLILRFFEAQKWDILIDGISIYDITEESLRKNIWVVFQENSLFNTTILENIKLDNRKASRKKIEEVAKKSHAADFIDKLSYGLDTIVWERGVKLSGWEKQRLAIARAFLKDAPILILDEATSALDAETEKYLQWSFDALMKGRTTFIIAHRLSTIQKADRIFVFDNGRIVEEGSYEQLIWKKWAFAKLVAAQTWGFVD